MYQRKGLRLKSAECIFHEKGVLAFVFILVKSMGILIVKENSDFFPQT